MSHFYMRDRFMGNNQIITAIIVGCGDRGRIYCEQGVHHFHTFKIVAAVDPDPVRLKFMQDNYGVSSDECFTNITPLLSRGKIADCVIDCTMDELHYSTAKPFLEQGYDMLLEKPIAPTAEEVIDLRETAKKHNCQLIICHVLRYTPFYRKIKDMILDGSIGEIMNICSSERVGTFHSSCAYLRGKWNKKSQTGSSFLLAKCCHDIDLLCWLNNITVPETVYSNGGRDFFIPKKAPKGSGTRCLVDCPSEIRKHCIYDAYNMYIENCLIPQYAWQCIRKPLSDITKEEKIESLKTYNPHGVCIYKTGGDLLDHQNVVIKFKNGSTAVHTLTMGCMRPARAILVQGTKGELEGCPEEGDLYFREYDPNTSWFKEKHFHFEDKTEIDEGHFGGDAGLIEDFCNMIQGKGTSVSCTSIDDSVNSHLVCYAADKSAETGHPVNLEL